jgi:hypothetical protein
MKTEHVEHIFMWVKYLLGEREDITDNERSDHLTTEITDPNVRKVTEMVRNYFFLLFRRYHKN